MTTTTNRFFHLNPESPARARLEEAENYFLAGNLNEALAAAQQAWREYPQEPDVFRVIAYLHMARGEYPPASQAAYQAVRLDPDNAASYAGLAQVYVTFNMLPMAIETLEVALKRYPDDPALLVLRADISFRRGKGKDAAPVVERVLEHNPHDGYAKALLGSYRLRTREYAAAASLLADAVAVYPQRWDYLRSYGIALLHQREYLAAREALALAFRHNPLDPGIKQYLFLAIKLLQHTPSVYWRNALFFYSRSGFGVLVLIIAALCIIAACAWGTVMAIWWNNQYSSAFYASLLFCGGVALIILAQAGTFLHSRKGKRFDVALQRMIEQG